MESRGVAYACEKYSLPLTILRVPIDEVGKSGCEMVKYDEAL